MNRFKEICDSLKDVENPIQVIDSVLHSGIVIQGNLNDFVNMSVRVAPNLTSEQLESLMEELRIKGVEDGDKLVYELTTDSSDKHVYEVKIGNTILAFNKV